MPAKTVSEFIAYAKANPRKLNMGSAGTGTSPHVAGELFKMMAGIDMVPVPYRSDDTRPPPRVFRAGPALTDLFGGQVQVTFVSTVASIEYIRASSVKNLKAIEWAG